METVTTTKGNKFTLKLGGWNWLIYDKQGNFINEVSCLSNAKFMLEYWGY